MRRAGPVSRAGSVCRDLGTSVKQIKNQLRLAGLKIYHVIVIAGPTLSRHLISLQSKMAHQKIDISLSI